LDQATTDYLEEVLTVCDRVLGMAGGAIWLTGSLATSDYRAARSDIDVVVVSSGGLSPDSKDALVDGLRHRSLPCPAHGLDLIAYSRQQVESVPRTPHYEVSIATGADWEDEVSKGGPYPGGLVDLAVARQSGRSVCGPTPQELVAAIPVPWILEELLNGLHWHTERIHHPFHDPSGSNAVLNACRALYYLRHRTLVSKTTGAEWHLGQEAHPVVVSALAVRRSACPSRLDHGSVLGFVRDAIRTFDAATA
jgi:hypothetical protein